MNRTMPSISIRCVLAFIVATLSARPASLAFSTAVNHSSATTNQMRSLAWAKSSVYIGYMQTTGANNREVDRQDGVAPSGAPLNTLTFASATVPAAQDVALYQNSLYLKNTNGES
jgi:hypothetical protein